VVESGILKYNVDVESLKRSAAALGEATVGRKCNTRTSFEREVCRQLQVDDVIHSNKEWHFTVRAHQLTDDRGLEGNALQKRLSRILKSMGKSPPKAIHLIWLSKKKPQR
jgi:hypothetical protein